MNNVSEVEKTVTIQLSGGLGNQLFQYAAARSLAVRNNSRLIIDTDFFDSRRHRKYELHNFSINALIEGQPGQPRWRKTLQSWLKILSAGKAGPVYSEPHMHFDPAWNSLTAPITLTGYFQSPRYFEADANLIRSELTPPKPSDAESLRMEEVLADSDSISVHVRRGDYVTNPSTRKIYCECTRDYYLNALARISGSGPVVFFSDDMAWVRDNLSVPQRQCFWVGEKTARTAISDLWLMSKAKHHVIANSTFSWWGAWLSKRDGGVTVAPAAWFRDTNIRCDDLIPRDWLRM